MLNPSIALVLQCKFEVLSQITIAGDASIDTLETLVLDYLGTVPKRTNAQLFVDQQEQSPIDPFPVYTMGRAKQLGTWFVIIFNGL